MNICPPLPLFIEETARQKIQLAEDAWNSRDPERVALASTEDSEWRNRTALVTARPAIIELLRRNWACELNYRLRKELWAFADNRNAVRFEYEFHDAGCQWCRAYGNENWEFAADGLMQRQFASINDRPITEAGMNIHSLNQQNFDSTLANSSIPVLGDFWAEGCRPCTMLTPVLEEIAFEEVSKVGIAKVNIDEPNELALRVDITGVPTLIVFKNSPPVRTLNGVQSRRAIQSALEIA